MPSRDNDNKFFKTDEIVSIVGNIAVTVVCLAFILPVFFKNIHAGYQYILICVGFMLLSAFSAFINAKQSRPAIRILPLLATYDVLIYITLFIANIIKVKNVTTFDSFIGLFRLSYFYRSAGNLLIISAIVLAFFAIIAFFNKYSDSLISVLIIMESIAFSVFFAWKYSTNSAYGRAVLAVSVILAFAWLFICTYSNVVTTKERRGTAFLSFIFAVLVFLFNFFYANNSAKGMNAFFVIPDNITDSVARNMYPWWLAILLTVVFIVMGTILVGFADSGEEEDVRSYADAKFFYAAAIITVLSKLLLTNYFAYSFILYIGVLIILHSDIKKDVSILQQKEGYNCYYDMENFVLRSLRLLYIAICFIFIIQIAENMLYVTLPVAAVIMYMLHKLMDNYAKKDLLEDNAVKSVLDGLPKSYHFSIVVLSVILTASLVYNYRFSISIFILLVLVVVTIIFVFAALKRKLPNNIKLPEINTVKWIATIFTVLVCVVITASSGAKLKAEYDMSKLTATISITANKKSTIENIEYKWDNGLIYDWYQELVAYDEPQSFEKESKVINEKTRENTMTLPVKGEMLTVWITDSNGVQTTRVIWFPIWFNSDFN